MKPPLAQRLANAIQAATNATTRNDGPCLQLAEQELQRLLTEVAELEKPKEQPEAPAP